MINLEKARELLAKAVETQGKDFVYNPGGTGRCAYRPIELGHANGPDDPRLKTGCLVGEALKIHGEHSLLFFRGSAYSMYLQARREQRDLMTEEAADYFQTAQTSQDAGDTWGRALELAEEAAERLIKARS
ncbi:hypothetical protein ACFWDN_13055 [Micromonospora chalcea]